jgi:hypothetical protein
MSNRARWIICLTVSIFATSAIGTALRLLSRATAAPAPATPAAATAPFTGDQIETAIEKGKAYLYAQEKNGNWETAQHPVAPLKPTHIDSGQWGQLTAMATYALLASGESPTDPRLASAITLLKSPEIKGICAIGMRCQVWQLLPQTDEVKALARKDCRTLVNALQPDTGMYDLMGKPTGVYRDASELGVLGVRACSEMGIEVPLSYWQAVDAGWRKAQSADGSWPAPANTTDLSESAFTAAGIGTLYITADELAGSQSGDSAGNASDANIENGLKWINANFEPIFKEKNRTQSLYGLEQIGIASGRKYFGDNDWYPRSVSELLYLQTNNGGGWGLGGKPDVQDTCLALTFLIRGRAPIAFNKLQYSIKGADGNPVEGNWNQRPRDVANICKWITEQAQIDRFLNWQVVTFAGNVDDLHEAPILYIAGDHALDLGDGDQKKLKTFIQQGGMVVFNADSDSTEFTDSVKKLAARLFPIPGEFRPLEATHPIFTSEQFRASNWTQQPVVLGLSNGVREMMLLLPGDDPSKAWQSEMTASHGSLFELGADILLYAADKRNIRLKGDSYIVEPDPAISTTRSLKLARIQYSGAWNPEPGGWRRLAAVMHNVDRLDLQVDPVTLGAGQLKNYKIAHLTGISKVRFSDAQWKELTDFVNAGGTLIIDSAGGSDAFASDIQTQLAANFPSTASQLETPLPADHLLYTQIADPVDIAYRSFARHVLTDDLKSPRLRGMTIRGKIGVFFSAEDITGGLVGEAVDGIVGYTPDTATGLMRKMILYAESGGNPVAAVAVEKKGKKGSKTN